MYYFTYIHTGELYECYTKSPLQFNNICKSLKVRKISDFSGYFNGESTYWRKL